VYYYIVLSSLIQTGMLMLLDIFSVAVFSLSPSYSLPSKLCQSRAFCEVSGSRMKGAQYLIDGLTTTSSPSRQNAEPGAFGPFTTSVGTEILWADCQFPG
jgi:hypothetical protein